MFFLLTLLYALPASGQYFSVAEGNRLADRLYENHLLSAAGRDDLKEQISVGRLPIYTHARPFIPDYGAAVSAGQLLGYLYTAYQSAYSYRQGDWVEAEVLQERGIRDPTELMPEMRQILVEAVQERTAAIPGREAELRAANALPAEEANIRKVDPPVFQVPRDLSDTLIPVDRSSFGYAARNTLRSVSDLGLLTSEVYEEAVKELNRDGLVPDYYLLQGVAQSAGEEEVALTRMRERKEAVRWLTTHELLPADAATDLLADTVFLRSVDRQDLYPYVRPQFTLSLTAPTTVQELIDQFTRELCTHDDRFCSIRVMAVPTAAYGGARDKNNRHVHLVGSDATGVYYTGPDLFIPPIETPFSDWSGTYMLELFAAPYNSRLSQDKADYRLYFLPAKAEGGAGTLVLRTFPLPSRLARALSAPEVTQVMGGLQGPDPHHFLSPSEATEIRDTLRELGFFESLTPEQWAAGTACIEARALDGVPEFFACFSTLTLPVTDVGEGTALSGNTALTSRPGGYYLFRPQPFGQLPLYLKLEPGASDFIERRFPGQLRRMP